MKTLFIIIGFMLMLEQAFAEGDRRVALIGHRHTFEPFEKTVTTPLGLATDRFENEAPAVATYSKYTAVIFQEAYTPKEGSQSGDSFWEGEENLQHIRDYLENGGSIFIFGPAFPRTATSAKKPRNLTALSSILGFSYYPKVTLRNPVEVQPAGAGVFENLQNLQWVVHQTTTVDKITSAEVLAIAVNKEGNYGYPFATRNRIGKGSLYWFGTSPFRLSGEVGSGSAELTVLGKVIQKALNGEQ